MGRITRAVGGGAPIPLVPSRAARSLQPTARRSGRGDRAMGPSVLARPCRRAVGLRPLELARRGGGRGSWCGAAACEGRTGLTRVTARRRSPRGPPWRRDARPRPDGPARITAEAPPGRGICRTMGATGLEPVTPSLSNRCTDARSLTPMQGKPTRGLRGPGTPPPCTSGRQAPDVRPRRVSGERAFPIGDPSWA